MESEFLKYLVLLERALSGQYAKTKDLHGYESVRTVLEFMEVHSDQHAQGIEAILGEKPRPVLKEGLITDFQNNLITSVFQQVREQRDVPKALEILADSENSLGLLYREIASHLRRLSAHYLAVADDILIIAAEEENHRDLLLKDRERLLKRKKED